MWWCTDVCPKAIPITKSIGQIKRLIKEEEKRKTAGS
jgi:succinate dehydrogenase/fumarate reductase-like Fe-S protein